MREEKVLDKYVLLKCGGHCWPLFSLQTLQVLGLKSVVLYKHRLAKVEKRWTTLHEQNNG
nr:MAG TPA: hypothetical protein [Caudoviricetes sp.]